ncbi:MAG: 1-(5-phosphoribosyl)-5-[(5-phosphoribosylamino)methylideneamino]imidazole-4-carboxamide isomerase [Pseudomonadota bacterium]|nr:1-(5-phosphoribosyl)-5-[(5-phosphoribosylamino)methylideneamino]imidazole-4-carboxamide isomerase [Pseudomonadota bacterium]
MDIFPAIDLKDGQCVRLTQGDFATATIYESDPLAQARKFADAGATWLHVVDLDGARLSEMQQFDVIAKIAKQTALRVQGGGGVRHEKTIQRLLDSGVERVVIGSLAVKNKRLVNEWLRKFGNDHIVLAFDIRLTDNEPEILTHGWQSGSQQLLWDVLDAYAESGLKTVLCTDVSRDGMLAGTNLDLYRILRDRWPDLRVLASGGVSGIGDVLDLAKLGTAGVIVGKALYEGRIDLKDALEQVKNAG